MAETFRALWRRAHPGAVEKRAPFRAYVRIDKIADEKRLVYGWASIVTKNGQPVVDLQGDVIPVDELEAMAHRFVQHARVGKAQHRGPQVARLVESVVLTKEKQQALGIDLGQEGWFVGFKVDDDEVWQRVKKGEFAGFSIGGAGLRTKVKEA